MEMELSLGGVHGVYEGCWEGFVASLHLQLSTHLFIRASSSWGAGKLISWNKGVLTWHGRGCRFFFGGD